VGIAHQNQDIVGNAYTTLKFYGYVTQAIKYHL
jgi:hypothetical protein